MSNRAEPFFIGSDIYRRSSYGGRHPLAIPRVSTVIDLSRALGWLPQELYLESPRAQPEELTRFHRSDYIAALMEAERRQALPEPQSLRYNIGRNGNPIFPEVFSRPATACGASLLAARLLAEGGAAYNPAGGTHHGRTAAASGFCYLNDPVLAILAFLDQGLERVFYLDLDAHHGDGVELAFLEEPRVRVVSLHEAGRWPMQSGGLGDLGDRGGGNAFNLPLPSGFNDSELAFLMEKVVLPLAEDFAPQALVLQCGADALEEDPLSRLSLSNGALWSAVAAVQRIAPRFLVLGGGGYNPWAVARCWTGVWGRLRGLEPPRRLPPEAEQVLRGLTWRHSRGRTPPERWFTTLRDDPRQGPIRREVAAIATAHGH